MYPDRRRAGTRLRRLHRQRRRALRPAILSSEQVPVIVCLCGSTRFLAEFDAASLTETLAGRIVLSIGSHRTSDAEALAHLTAVQQTELFDRLAVLHRHKIDLADEVLVINVGGYLGHSTRAEIAYAQQQGKRLRYLEDSLLDS